MPGQHYDVVIVGGAYSGAGVAIQLLRKHPKLRLLIVEKAAEFDRKVGEATTEISAGYMTRVLGLSGYLSHHHIPKQGLRFWFTQGKDQPFEEMAEIGPRNNTRYFAFQIDRSHLDEHLLQVAVKEGAELLRPAKVESIELNGLGKNRMVISVQGEKREVTARWAVDASGRAALFGRKLGILKQNEVHQINALWARFRGVKDLDGPEMWKRFPKMLNDCRTARFAATNHMTGLGWWVWMIPLKGGDYSIGLVYDPKLFRPPEGANIGERLKAHFATHPFGREVLSEVEVIDNDMRAYSNLPYYCEQIIGDGWAMAGDACGFLDPLYSPGLDFCSFTSSVVQDVISRELAGEDISMLVERQNREFRIAYDRWVYGIYKDKYYYIGEADLMLSAMMLDVGAFFLGPVRSLFADAPESFLHFPYNGKPGEIVGRFMAFYNRRLAAIAKKRKAAGTLTQINAGWRKLVLGFSLDFSLRKLIWLGLKTWMKAEWNALFLHPAPGRAKKMPEDPEVPAAAHVSP